MNVLVLGGSGFVGSHVADALSAAGHSVRVFDLRSSAYLRADQTMLVGDLLDLPAVREATVDCDVVYNFAGIADIDEARDRPVDTVKANVLGNVHALEAARLRGVHRFVFASTVYVYSDSGSFYRASKQACELFVEEYHKRYGLEYSVLRYGSLYGRRADRHNNIYRLLAGALMEARMYYPGTGDELREFIHVEDAARYSVHILAPEFANQHVIISGYQTMRVRDLMEMIAEILGREIKLEFGNRLLPEHYKITPYKYYPRLGRKLVGDTYTDIGQGIMDCLAELQERLSDDRAGHS